MARIVTESYPDFVRMSFSSQQQSCWVFQDAFINNASIITRYPEDFSKLIEVYPVDIVTAYLQQTKDVISWLKQNEKLKK
jgi:hypothetical protein